jgi:putative ABC transport system ATP-binding protein
MIGTPPMIELDDLRFAYPEGDFALEVPKLRVERGERVALVGPSGSGKTTILNLVAGIAVPHRGRILVAGEAIAALSDSARRSFRVQQIGLVFQEFELLEYLSVLDNILLPYRIHPSLRLETDVRDRARSLADRLGIGHVLGRSPARLSQGERQRAAVCRALVTQPALLLADEPTGNLDPNNKGRVMDALFEIAKENGATLLTVTHDHDLVPRFDRAVDVKEFYAGDAT